MDPITREIIKNALISIADTMAATVVRSARSHIIKDNMDFSTAVMSGEGEQIAQGLSLPVHLGAMQPALDAIRDQYEDDIHPGDIFINNDPYEGASHLPDLFTFKPVFDESKVLAWMAVVGHQLDIGGRVAGGNACDSTEIYQEGLRIPPLKLFVGGEINHTLWRILSKNVRMPDMVLGDIQSQIAALRRGEQDLLQLTEEWGSAGLAMAMKEIIRCTEQMTRDEIKKLPDGEYEFEDFIDDDGIKPDPIKIKLKLCILDDEITVDFEGTSPVAKGAINPNYAMTQSCVYAAIKSVMEDDFDVNAGFFEPIEVSAPEGSFVNPAHPAPVAARGLGGIRVSCAVFGAMAKALPDRVPAIWGGGEVGLSIAGYDENKKYFLHTEFNNDGPRGGGPHGDGTDGISSPILNLANTPVEVLEANLPIRVRQYGFSRNTEGPGQFRGGMGMVREYEFLADDVTLQIRSDRAKFPPWGLKGGQHGVGNRNTLIRGTENKTLPGKFIMNLRKGDVYRMDLAGGGGYGLPHSRDPKKVLEDVRQERISCAHAREAYAVVIDPETLSIDAQATEDLRKRIAGNQVDMLGFAKP